MVATGATLLVAARTFSATHVFLLRTGAVCPDVSRGDKSAENTSQPRRGSMNQTFEELAAQQIDGLYQGALFLKGGEDGPAGDLLLWTLTGAFHAFRDIQEGRDPARWLEGRMVQTFLSSLPAADASDGASVASRGTGPPPVTGTVGVDPHALHEAAGRLPPRARAALWLVALRRWQYAEASAVMDTDLERLKDLLQYRHMLMTAIIRGDEGRNGTDGDMT